MLQFAACCAMQVSCCAKVLYAICHACATLHLTTPHRRPPEALIDIYAHLTHRYHAYERVVVYSVHDDKM